MANLYETSQWEEGIYQLETRDRVLAGPGGIANRQALELANRTLFLKDLIEELGGPLPSHQTVFSQIHYGGDRPSNGSMKGALAWANHRHSMPAAPTSVSGNAGTATKLATGRLINSTDFDGSQNITTQRWGHTRSFTIGNASRNVDGSSAVFWTLAEIGAAGVNSPAFTGTPICPTPPLSS